MTRARGILAAFVAAGLCAAAMWLWTLDPKLRAAVQNPLQTRGRIGEVVTNDVFSVRVDRYDVAATVTRKFGNGPDIADGIFVVVRFRARAEREPFAMGHVRLETRGGLSYDEGGRGGFFGDAEKTYQPMLWTPGTLLFEIPKDRLAGSRVVFGQADPLNQLSAEAVVDLGIDKATAARLAARPPAGYELGD
ncbi:MAG TPA: hypothetical protein VF069_22825 [Streptosporangiaceae bacterium]